MKRVSKMLGLIIAVGIFYFASGASYQVCAATVSGSSADDTFATANQMNMGDTASGSITETNDLDNYRFQLDAAGCVTLNMTSYMRYYCIRIYGSDGEECWYTDNNEWTETVGYRRDTHKVYLEKGTYYMQINGHVYNTSYESIGKGRYECRTSFASSGVNNVESDNDFSTANNITIGNTIIGQISENDDYDTYKFALSQVGCVTLDMTSYMRYYCIKIFNSDGEEIWDTDDNEWTESVGYRRDTYKVYLEKGTYYMQINGYWYGKNGKSTGKYVCKTSFVSSGVSFDGDDNSFGAAKSISWNKAYTGQISVNDEFDTYKFVVPKDRIIAINMTSYMQYYCIVIYDSVGGEIWDTGANEWDSKVGYRKDFHNVELKKGTYYMQIYGARWTSSSEKSQGKYVFSIEPLTQSNCIHKYTDKWVSETYFAKGYTLHKCEKCGKSHKDNYSPMKKLGQGYLSTSSYSGKGRLYLQWYTVSDASGYQIRYCKNRSMKKGVVTKTVKGRTRYKTTIKKLSRRKRYYIQVRAYKKSGAKVVYGKWSSKRSLRTK